MKKLQTKLYGMLGIMVLSASLLVTPAFAQVSNGTCPTYLRDLTIGYTGSDVVSLQTFLESKGLLNIPQGISKGYFGSLTAAALAKYQASQGIAPAVGYFGPITRGNIQKNCTPGNSGGNGNNSGNNLSGGEASLEKFDLSAGDDSNVKEGSSAEIAEIEFDVEDGDVLIDRIDLQLVADSGNDEEDPWDTFESLTLSIDGKEVADIDLSDEDEYLDEDDGTFRLSGINYKIDEGDTATIVVEVTAQNSVDGADNDASNWTLNVLDDGIRATDAEGIQQYVGSDAETVDFEVVARGDGEELNVSSSNDDPDSTTLEVVDDEKSDEHEIFAFELSGEESDIEIDTVQVVLNSSTDVSNVVSDLILEIDGEEFDDWSFVGSGTSTRTVEFDIDGDYTLDADDEVTVVLKAEFKSANGSNYSSGATIQASILDNAIEGEGGDDVVSDGSLSGDTHTLATEGITTSLGSKAAKSTGTDNKIGQFTFSIDVASFEADSFVELSATRGTTESDTGFNVVILDGNNNVVTTGTTTFSIEADEDETSNSRVRVNEGEQVTFDLTVFYDADTAGSYKAQLYSVNHNDTDADADTQFLLVSVSTYRTSATYVEQ